jgi:hypothetical protein
VTRKNGKKISGVTRKSGRKKNGAGNRMGMTKIEPAWQGGNMPPCH